MTTGWRNGLRQGERGYWHFRFRLKGILHEGNTGCTIYRDAVSWLNAYKGRLSKGAVGLKAVPTVKTAYECMIAEKTGKVSQAHIDRAARAIELHVLPYIGHKPADQVTKADVEELLRHYLQGDSKRITDAKVRRKRTKHGANTLLLYIRIIFGYLKDHGILERIPFKVDAYDVGRPHRATVPIELEPQFFAAIDKTRNIPVMIAVRAMFWLGLRESEALGMRWEGLSWDLQQYVPGSTIHNQTKGKEAEALPTDQGLRALLWSIIWEEFEGIRPLKGWVIPAEDGKPHRAQFTKKAIERAGTAIRIPGLTPHRMRAGLATNLARAGYGAHHIQLALRHKRIETSEHYVRLGSDDLQRGMDDLRKRAKGE